MTNTPLNRLRVVAFLEGCSYLLLGFTMILKYKFLMPKPNYIVGMAHGALFIAYIILLLEVWYKYKWSFKIVLLSFMASLIPFGTFYAEVKWFRQN
jgi:integral membrane protein